MSVMQRAVQYDRVGGPEVLTIRETPIPTAGEERIVVTVEAVGLNPYDGKVLSGRMPSSAPFPRGICGDVAGIVSAVGDGATRWDGAPIAVGDRVFGWGLNTLREEVALRASSVAGIPDGVGADVAGSLPTPGLTALGCLDVLRVEPGRTALVSAAAGAVGFLVAQLLVARGVRVVGTAGESAHARLRDAGLDPVTSGDGLADRLRAVAPEIDAVFDQAGAEIVHLALTLGIPADRICTTVATDDAVELGLHTPSGERSPRQLATLARLVAAGSLDLPVQQVLPLDDAQEAFTLLAGRNRTGKIVVSPSLHTE